MQAGTRLDAAISVDRTARELLVPEETDAGSFRRGDADCEALQTSCQCLHLSASSLFGVLLEGGQALLEVDKLEALVCLFKDGLGGA